MWAIREKTGYNPACARLPRRWKQRKEAPKSSPICIPFQARLLPHLPLPCGEPAHPHSWIVLEVCNFVGVDWCMSMRGTCLDLTHLGGHWGDGTHACVEMSSEHVMSPCWVWLKRQECGCYRKCACHPSWSWIAASVLPDLLLWGLAFSSSEIEGSHGAGGRNLIPWGWQKGTHTHTSRVYHLSLISLFPFFFFYLYADVFFLSLLMSSF